jgi:acyl carrier protein
MTLEEKLALITETIDTEENLKPETQLSDIEEWDSMAVISTIAMLDRKFGRVLSAEQIEGLQSVNDILNLMA